MTVLAGKLHSLNLYTGARRSATLAMVPFMPERIATAASTRTVQRLTVATDALENLGSKRTFDGLLDVTRGALEALHAAPTDRAALSQARSAASLGRETLRAESDVAKHLADAHEYSRLVWSNAANGV